MDLKITEYANSIFEQPWWLDIVAKDSWREVCVAEEGKIKARLPVVEQKGAGVYRIRMPKLTQTLGIWMEHDGERQGNKYLAREKELVNGILEQLSEAKDIKICLDSVCSYTLPYIWKGFKVSPRYSYRIKDLSDLERVYSQFGKVVKKNIKSAKNKVTITDKVNSEILYELLERTFRNQGRGYPHSKELIQEIVRESERREAGRMLTAIDAKGNVHACSYFIYDKNVCYYLMSGSDPEHRSSGAQTLILWEGIQFASKVSKNFDFEGSMIEGIEAFFRPFGGELVTNYEISKRSLGGEIYDVLKPRVKKMIGYR